MENVESVQEFEPSKWRHFSSSVTIATIGTLLGAITALIFWDAALDFAAILLIGEVIVAWIDAASVEKGLKIVITDDTIEGASAPGWHWIASWKRISFPLAEIDKTKTGEQSRFDRLTGDRRIWSLGGQCILLGSAFEKVQVESILARIGCLQEPVS